MVSLRVFLADGSLSPDRLLENQLSWRHLEMQMSNVKFVYKWYLFQIVAQVGVPIEAKNFVR